MRLPRASKPAIVRRNEGDSVLPNESDTSVVSDQSQSESARHESGNGYDSTAAQYNAIHEAHLAHEQILRELRQEIQHQQEKLAQLGEAAPTEAAPRMEAVQLRLSELERKMSEGASDPLLNEIVHRLASLEQDPARGGKDPEVAQLTAQLAGLKQELEGPRDDPRTDEMVLRLASLEGAASKRTPKSVWNSWTSASTDLWKI